ncbi:MAG: 1-acyl-sn-glycerol-3-phosphate acyltransferase, partial [Acidobacteriota bacterium]
MERPVSRRRRALSSGDRVLNENAVEGENACASPGPEARRQPTFLPTLAKSILDVFYREVEVTGAHKVRAEGALVVVGNHGAALLDPALFTGYLPRAPRFLAKSTLWKNPAVLPFLRLGAAIPVYRRQDPGVDPADNMATFRICHEVLAARGVIGLFPEGKSHHEPSLTALKTGVARIVLQAMTRFPGLDVEIVPVGLTFDDKTRFRSRALLTVGDPIRPAEILAARRRELAEVAEVEEAARPETADADPEQVEALIQAIRRGLLEVTLNYPSWEEARLIERAAEIFSRPDPRPPAETSLGRSFESRQVFIEGYQDLAECFPEEVREVAEEVR